jgi:nitrogenase-stabilizing/protective protein
MTHSRGERPIDETGILDKLERLSAAEDFFAVLDVPYDEARLRVARLHILKRMGEYLKGDDLAGLPDALAATRARATLQRAHADFERSSPLAERVFRVLKEHDP